MIQDFYSRQFISFLITGGIAATVNFLSRIFFNQYFSFSTSVLLAYLMGMVTAFILAKLFVFKVSTQSIRRSALLFFFVNILAVAQTWLISMSLNFYILPALGFEKYVAEIASAVGIAFPVFTSYLGHKRWSFK